MDVSVELVEVELADGKMHALRCTAGGLMYLKTVNIDIMRGGYSFADSSEEIIRAFVSRYTFDKTLNKDVLIEPDWFSVELIRDLTPLKFSLLKEAIESTIERDCLTAEDLEKLKAVKKLKREEELQKQNGAPNPQMALEASL